MAKRSSGPGGVQFSMEFGRPVKGRRKRRGSGARSRPQGQAQQVYVMQPPPQRKWFDPRRRLESTQPTAVPVPAGRVPVVPREEWVDPEPTAEEIEQIRRAAEMSTLWRARRILAPWLIPLLLVLPAALAWQPVAWFVNLLGADRAWVAAAAGLLAGFAVIRAIRKVCEGVTVGSWRMTLDKRWWPRLYAFAAAGWAWEVAAVYYGIHRWLLGVLVLATVALSLPWWRRHRPADPDEKPQPDTEPDAALDPARDEIVALFDKYAACKGGPADGCKLIDANTNDHRSTYTMEIRPGKDSLNSILNKQEMIATAVKHDPPDLIIESHPTRKATLQLTVIRSSPVQAGVDFTGPRWVDDDEGNSWVETGPYADGDGVVKVPRISDYTSAENALIVANRGGGKSSLLLSGAISDRSSGKAMLIYLDGKGGASSPILRTWADWAPIGVTDRDIRINGLMVLTMLEQLLAARRRQCMLDGISGLVPSPEQPFVQLIIDECHKFFNEDPKIVKRWTDLFREMRAFGMGVEAATQGTKITSFGNESDIREFLGGNTTIVGRLRSGQAPGLLRVGFDPSTLARGGGWFFIDAANGRSAQWRAWRVRDKRSAPTALDSEADEWFARLPAVGLEEPVLAGLPEFYRRRAELAAIHEKRMERGEPVIGADHPVTLEDLLVPPVAVDPTESSKKPAPANAATGGASDGGWQPLWPTLPETGTVSSPIAPAVTEVLDSSQPPPELKGSALQVWRQVADGHATAAEIILAAGLGKSQVYELLGRLEKAGLVTKHGKRYTPA